MTRVAIGALRLSLPSLRSPVPIAIRGFRLRSQQEHRWLEVRILIEPTRQAGNQQRSGC